MKPGERERERALSAVRVSLIYQTNQIRPLIRSTSKLIWCLTSSKRQQLEEEEASKQLLLGLFLICELSPSLVDYAFNSDSRKLQTEQPSSTTTKGQSNPFVDFSIHLSRSIYLSGAIYLLADQSIHLYRLRSFERAFSRFLSQSTLAYSFKRWIEIDDWWRGKKERAREGGGGSFGASCYSLQPVVGLGPHFLPRAVCSSVNDPVRLGVGAAAYRIGGIDSVRKIE